MADNGGQTVAVQPRRWSREEYGRMVDTGILGPADHVELIDGEIVTMTPQKSRHATAVRLTEIALRTAFGHEAVDIRTQLPLALGPATTTRAGRNTRSPSL